MRFPGIGMKAQRSIYCRLGPGEPGRSVILTKKVKLAMDLAQEEGPGSSLDLELRGWLAFAVQKLDEVATLVRGLEEGDAAIAGALARSGAVLHGRGPR